MKTKTLLLLAAGVFLLPSCKPPEPPKITATETGKSGPGAQTIKGGNVTLTFAADGKPLAYARGNATNILNPKDPGPGFYMTTGSGAEEKTIPFTSIESKDGKLILTADDKTRATLAVNAGPNYFSFRLEQLENVPKDSEPVLNFKLNFNNACPQFVPFDYMCITSGRWASIRCFGTASWPFFWKRGASDPLGGLWRRTRRTTTKPSSACGRTKKCRTRRSRVSGPTSGQKPGCRSGRRPLKMETS
jgi:hypothetical protein